MAAVLSLGYVASWLLALTHFVPCRLTFGNATESLAKLTVDFTSTTQNLAQTENHLSVVDNQISELLAQAQEQKKAVDALIQEDINGAFNTIKANEKR